MNTTQYIGDYNNTIGESLLTNQCNGMTEGFTSDLGVSENREYLQVAISKKGE
jgi:hypothetical protein